MGICCSDQSSPMDEDIENPRQRSQRENSESKKGYKFVRAGKELQESTEKISLNCPADLPPTFAPKEKINEEVFGGNTLSFGDQVNYLRAPNTFHQNDNIQVIEENDDLD